MLDESFLGFLSFERQSMSRVCNSSSNIKVYFHPSDKW